MRVYPRRCSRVLGQHLELRLLQHMKTCNFTLLRKWGRAKGAAKASCGETVPGGPARHLDVSRQKLTPHCLATIFDAQLPSPKLSPKMPPKLSLAHKRGHFFLFQNCPRGEGNCETIERQKVSRGNFCPATSRCLFWPTGVVQKGVFGEFVSSLPP